MRSYEGVGSQIDMVYAEEVGRAEFNVATPTYATVTCTSHVCKTYVLPYNL